MYHPPQPGIFGSARPAGASESLPRRRAPLGMCGLTSRLSDSVLLAEELVQELAEFLVRRYPALYAVTRYEKGKRRGNGWGGVGQVKTITIVPLEVTYDLESEDPLKVANLLFVLSTLCRDVDAEPSYAACKRTGRS